MKDKAAGNLHTCTTGISRSGLYMRMPESGQDNTLTDSAAVTKILGI